jgi:hypothetical protein
MRNILLSAATVLLAGTTLVGSVHSAELPKGAAHNIVLVHGAFVDQTSWQPVAEILTKKGYNVTLVENPLTSLAADVDATKQALAKQDGKDRARRPLVGRRGDHASRQRSQGFRRWSTFPPSRRRSVNPWRRWQRPARRPKAASDPSRREGQFVHRSKSVSVGRRG